MEKVPYEKLLRYPRLIGKDKEIWDRFVDDNPGFFKEVAYDVKVGEGREYPESELPGLTEAMIEHSKRRIDVVGFKNDEIYVIEVRTRASFGEVGKALGLADLFREIAPTDKTVIPAIITDEILPDMEAYCKKMGVLLFLA